MSVIAVEGLPPRIGLGQVVRMLAKAIRDEFKALNFSNSDCGSFKTCYLQLSAKLDPVEVVENINTMLQAKPDNIRNAFIPENVPDLAVKPLFLNKKIRKKFQIAAGVLTPVEVLSVAHMEILTELQYKYTKLCNLSTKSSHKLLKSIGMTVEERLEKLLANGAEVSSNPCLLTERYRKLHPHFGDFQLILGALHRLEAEAGAPRTRLQEADLMDSPSDKSWRISALTNTSGNNEQQMISKYSQRIMRRLEQHVSSFQLNMNPQDEKEQVVRSVVQTHLANMVPHLPTIMNELMSNHSFVNTSKNKKFEKIRMYGDPCLPGELLTAPVLKRCRAQHLSRCKTMYNLITFNVPPKALATALALDGTYLGDSKLIVRSTNVNTYRVPVSKKSAVTEVIEVPE